MSYAIVMRAFHILKRRGEIPDIALDGRYVMLDYRSPLARMQGQGHVQNILTWINTVSSMGPEAASSIDIQKAVKLLGESLGVPGDLIQQELLPVDLAVTEVSNVLPE